MNLLCRLGWHQPAPTPRWHDGLYFSRCLSCGVDLVRMPGGRWSEPRDVRVLWDPPAAAAQVPAAAAAAESDHAPTAAEAAFEAPEAGMQGLRVARERERAAGPGGSGNGVFAEPDRATGRGAPPAAAGAASPPPLPSRERIGDGETESEARRALLWPVAAIAGAGALAGAAVAVIFLAGLLGRTAASPPRPPAPVAARAPDWHGGASALVTGDRGGCTPAERARLRRHRRGGADQQVRIVDEDGRWIMLSRAATPCWTLRTGRFTGSASSTDSAAP